MSIAPIDLATAEAVQAVRDLRRVAVNEQHRAQQEAEVKYTPVWPTALLKALSGWGLLHTDDDPGAHTAAVVGSAARNLRSAYDRSFETIKERGETVRQLQREMNEARVEHLRLETRLGEHVANEKRTERTIIELEQQVDKAQRRVGDRDAIIDRLKTEVVAAEAREADERARAYAAERRASNAKRQLSVIRDAIG